MKVYTVHAPSDAPDAEDRAVFIKDGLSWLALFVPLPWLIWRRQWTALVWWIAFVLVVAWTGRLLGDDPAAVLAILGQILFAMEANNLRRSSLARRGWDDLGESFGRNMEEAELRFFHGRGRAGDAAAAVSARPAAPPPSLPFTTSPPYANGNVIGLFPEAER